MLVHALAVARHHGVMLAAATEALPSAGLPGNGTVAAADSLAQAPICHAAAAGGGLETAIPSDGSQPPPGAKPACPICLGLTTAMLLAPPQPSVWPAPSAMQPVATLAHADQRRTVQLRLRPPSRGPPLLA